MNYEMLDMSEMIGRHTAIAIAVRLGYPLTGSMLQNLVAQGNGPEYTVPAGKAHLYRTGDFISWLKKTFPLGDMRGYLKRTELLQYLKDHGYPYARASIATLTCLGYGPPSIKIGKHSYHDPKETLAWAKARYEHPHHPNKKTADHLGE